MTDNDHFEPNAADAPPGAVIEDALALADDQLQRVREGNTSYADTVAVLERIAALLRGAA